jgi:2-polyprenyl-6-methoxyphenol hydroxylase-like FAD-dependent oxidoreductase
MAGEEFARIHSWGNQPERQGEYYAASPCRHVDLPQTELEPILVKFALDNGWTIRFDSSFVEYQRDGSDGPITSTIKDNLSGQTYTIKSKYLFGCDGARSQIIRQLDIPLLKKPGQGLAINVLVEADLSKHMKNRTGNLHWIFTPELEHPAWGWTCVLRMVKAWDEWMFIMLPEPGFEDLRVRPSNEEYLKRIGEMIGDDSIPVKIKVCGARTSLSRICC